MDLGLEMLDELLPFGDCWLLSRGGEYARYGTSTENIGVLAFASRAKADRFIKAIARGYEAECVSKRDLIELAYDYDDDGKICVAAASTGTEPRFAIVIKMAEGEQDGGDAEEENEEYSSPTPEVNWLKEGF